MSVKLMPVHPVIYGPTPAEAVDHIYDDAMAFHRFMMRNATPEEEKARLALLMKIVVGAAMELCQKEGCLPRIDGVLDLCRDACLWAERRGARFY